MAGTWLTDDLVLGWRVDGDLHPIYWLNPKAKLGKHQLSDLAVVPRAAINHHTMIIAQSGSGKSFFIGRLIEEILLKTRSRIVAIDPNADFRRMKHVAASTFWIPAKSKRARPRYSTSKRIGFLPEETSSAKFAVPWRKVSKEIHANVKDASAGEYRRTTFHWLSLSTQWLFDDVDASRQTELDHFHYFVLHFTNLLRHRPWKDAADHLGFIHSVCEDTKSRTLERKGPEEIAKILQDALPAFPSLSTTKGKSSDSVATRLELGLRRRQPSEVRAAATALSFVSHSTEQYYFSVMHEMLRSDLIDFGPDWHTESVSVRLQVLDLPSIETTPNRLLAVSAFIDREWLRARFEWEYALRNVEKKGALGRDHRVPTFIFVDEAHDLVFANPEGAAEKRLQEQFRTIAAEGRKYGLFLVLATQRPDKIDPFVVSEMENRALMRIGSEAVLTRAKELLSLEDDVGKFADKCRSFTSGRALLVGPWTHDVKDPFLYAAMRRTPEGGRNLDEKWWTKMEEAVSAVVKRPKAAVRRVRGTAKHRDSTRRGKKPRRP